LSDHPRALGGAPADLFVAKALLPQTRKVVRHRPARFMRSMAIVYAGGPGHTGGTHSGLSTGMLGTVYQSVGVLAEVGRVTIDESRLDL